MDVRRAPSGVPPRPGVPDHRHAQELFSTLRDQVLREFHDRDEQGIPRAWVARVKASLRTNGPGFAAGRMRSPAAGGGSTVRDVPLDERPPLAERLRLEGQAACSA